MKREEGLYWVKYINGSWTIAQWVNDYFMVPGYQQRFIPEWFEEIDERRIVRDEPCKDNQFKGAKLHVWDKDGNHIGTINCDPD